MEFGSYLRRLRVEANLTQKELARKCGLSDAYMNRVENQETDPPTRRVCSALARALKVNENDLWKHAFVARLEKWLKREGFRKLPQGLTAGFYNDLIGPE